MARRADQFTQVERETIRGIQRTCYAGLDSVAVRQEVQRQVTPLVPNAGFCLGTCDPDTGLINHAVGGGKSPRLVKEFLERFYADEFLRTMDAASRGEQVVDSNDPAVMELRASEELGTGIHLTLSAEHAIWGAWILMREKKASPFSDRDTMLLAAVAPHLAKGLKLGRLIEAARFQEALSEMCEPPEEERPAVVVLDARCRPTLMSASAAALLDDIRDVGFDPEALPTAVTGARSYLLTTTALAPETASAGRSVRLRTRGRSGRWYWVRALLTEPDPAGESATMIIVEPVRRNEMAPILSRLYGLTPREREILWRAAIGESTHRISRALGISAYTVQDHLDHACRKVGVRGRRALVAKIFLDGYLEGIVGAHA
jgi:DNA-binding CsgD family transcriptional regulator